MNRPKTIVITGVSTGIGYACADQFTKQGYRVWGSVRKEEDANRLQAEFGERFTPLLMDVTDSAAIKLASKQVEDELQGETLGGLINNAGIAVDGPLQHIEMDRIRQQFEVNVIGLIDVTQQFLPLLGAADNFSGVPGRIINISSVGGQVAAPFIAPYIGTKHAVEGISHSLRRELQIYGIDVIIIAPGPIITAIWGKGIETDAFQETAYHEAFSNFSEYFQEMGKDGLPAKFLGNKILGIHEAAKPRTYYAFLKGKIANYTLPKLLPDRTVDQMIGRQIGLIKKE
ncbi:MAG: SDR family NAD(P)-dependent oxidoreductase [Bacteroidota bacterium]